MKKVCLALVVVAACGSDTTRKQLFTPKPECMGDPITPYQGTDPVVINTLAIGSLMDGFDLDGDGKPDNKLSAVSSLAQSQIDNSIKNYEIVIPIEYFDMPMVAQDSCVKFAIYLGKFDTDGDGDGKRPGIDGGDCNDHDPNVKPGATEVVGNLKDDDCDGLADEDAQNNPSTDTTDHDGDGQSMAQGDCDDNDKTVYKGAQEICGDGKDNNCDGVADRTVASTGPDPCGPFVSTADITLDKLSFDDSGAPVIAFDNGSIDKNLLLDAGPSIFSVNIPVTNGITLDLKITGAQIQGDMQSDGTTMNGRLGGVIDARSMDTITGLDVSQIGLTPNDSLLDATFGNLLGPLLALPKANAAIQKKYPGCRTPDIDVDGDGLEAFCSSDPNATNKVADICIDGDGTVVMSTFDDQGKILTHCAQATDSKGKPRFVDGISVEMNFNTTAIHSIKPPKM
jgi:putative metal-binding protein